jgi:hypothetical protein
MKDTAGPMAEKVRGIIDSNQTAAIAGRPARHFDPNQTKRALWD